MRRAQCLQQWLRRRLAGLPPVRNDNQVRVPDRAQIIRNLAGKAATTQRRGRFTGYHPHIEIGQDTIVLRHVEHAERERHDPQRNAVENHHHEPRGLGIFSYRHAKIVTRRPARPPAADRSSGGGRWQLGLDCQRVHRPHLRLHQLGWPVLRGRHRRQPARHVRRREPRAGRTDCARELVDADQQADALTIGHLRPTAPHRRPDPPPAGCGCVACSDTGSSDVWEAEVDGPAVGQGRRPVVWPAGIGPGGVGRAAEVIGGGQASGWSYELIPLAADQGLGVLVWSPLAGGLLSGKYRRDQRPSADSRQLTDWNEPPVYEPGKLYDIVDVLIGVGEQHGVSAAQVALAFMLGKPAVTSLVVGARTEGQLADNLAAATLSLTDAEREQLDKASAPPLIYPYWHQAKTARDRLSPADMTLLGPHLR